MIWDALRDLEDLLRVDPPKDETELQKLIRMDGSICPECAKSCGAVWPEGHVATFSCGTCSICGKHVSTCAVSDWNWPLQSGRKASREF